MFLKYFYIPIYTVSTSFDVCPSRWDSFGTSDFWAVCVQWRGWLWTFGSSEGAKVDCLQQQDEKTKRAAAATNNQRRTTCQELGHMYNIYCILYTKYVYTYTYIYKYTLTNKHLAHHQLKKLAFTSCHLARFNHWSSIVDFGNGPAQDSGCRGAFCWGRRCVNHEGT